MRAAYHHGNLREAILEAGLAHLEKSADEALSLRELARQTGVAANAVYRHFASKEQLLAALAAEGFRDCGPRRIAPCATPATPLKP